MNTEVTALLAGSNIVAIIPKKPGRPGRTCYIPAPDSWRRINPEFQSALVDKFVNLGALTKQQGQNVKQQILGVGYRGNQPSLLPFEQVVIEVTQACNHACVHCYNYWSEHRGPVSATDALSRAEILRLSRDLRSATSLKGVAFSGGEPMLREDLAGITGDLMEDGLNVVVISNGSLLTGPVVRVPCRYGVELTLFSADAKVHDRIAGRAGAFERVVEAAITVQQRKCRLAMACVVTRLNLAGLKRTIELALALGAEGILLTGSIWPRRRFPKLGSWCLRLRISGQRWKPRIT